MFVRRGACGTDDVRPLSVSLTDCAEIPECETPARQQRRRRSRYTYAGSRARSLTDPRLCPPGFASCACTRPLMCVCVRARATQNSTGVCVYACDGHSQGQRRRWCGGGRDGVSGAHWCGVTISLPSTTAAATTKVAGRVV